MPIYKVHKEGCCWGIWKTDETLDELSLLFPEGKRYLQEATARFANEKRRKEWLAVRVLLFHLLGEAKEIAYYPSGKPYLLDASYHIGISHTNGYVAVALHPQYEVAVDIEQYGTRVMRVKERFMREDEMAEADNVYACLLHWSAKETLFKLMGEDNVDFREHLHIMPFSAGNEGVLEACEYKTLHQARYTLYYRVEKDFVLTWCVDTK